MSIKRYVELINMYIDREIAPEEKEELLSILESDSEARKFYEEIESLNEILSRVREADPPVEMVREVSAMLTPRAHGYRRGVSIRGAFAGRVRLGYVCLLIIGVGLGAGFYAALSHLAASRGEADLEKLHGTIPPASEEIFHRSSVPVLLEEDGVEGSIEVGYSKMSVSIDLDLTSAASIEVVIDHEGTLEPTHFEPRSPTEFVLTTRLQSTSIAYRGRGQCGLLFRKEEGAPGSIRIRFLRGERILFERVLPLERN